MILSVDDVKFVRDEVLKFVRVAGEYRFCRPTAHQHRDLVRPGEKALSAGTLTLRGSDEFSFPAGGLHSATLGIGVEKLDIDRLSMLLGRTFRKDTW